jgi:hypothetical protein
MVYERSVPIVNGGEAQKITSSTPMDPKTAQNTYKTRHGNTQTEK